MAVTFTGMEVWLSTDQAFFLFLKIKELEDLIP